MRILVVLLLALVLAVPCVAGPDVSEVFADCDFWRTVPGATVTLDTLWFSRTAPTLAAGTATAGAGNAGMDWFPPAFVPYGHLSDGSLIKTYKPVKRVLLYSRVPFMYRPFSAGGVNKLIFDIADTNTTAGVSKSDTYPCWTVLSYPDSVRVAESGADSVQVMVGY